MSRRISPFIPPLLLLFCLGLQLANGRVTDTLRPGQSLTTSETIVSAKGKFELGFFSPGNSTRYYVGIWYKKDPNRTVVWVANRKRPFPDSSAVLTLNPNGTLVISGGIMQYTVSNTSAGNDTAYAMLLDTGNFRVTKVSGVVLWQSFEHPTDTLLPGMNISDVTTGWSLKSWKSTEEPAPGLFSLHLGSWNELLRGSWKELIVMKGSETYWSSALIGRLADMFVIDGESVTWRSKYTDTDDMLRIVLDVTGQFRLLSWTEVNQSWQLLSSPKCGAYALCGDYSICSETTDRGCDCLPGFKQLVAEGNKSSGRGCVRKINLQCGNDTQFSPLSQVDWPSNPNKLDISDSAECMSACLTNCSCIAYAYDHRKHDCLVWEGPLLNVKQLSKDDGYGNDFYLKLDRSESITKGHKNTKVAGLLWAVIIPTTSLALVFSLFVYCVRRKKKLKRKGVDLLLLDLSMTIESNSSELTESSRHGDSRRGEVKMPLFSFASVSAATDNFSSANKLGEGGFGPVYKGILLRGDEVAVKRLSRRSGQGWEELKNEAMLIATLQHKNLVRLLGCCIEGDEKILVYEYMPNKSLDFFLFDPEKRNMLDWGKRIQIIQGVAQGLLYIHQYSRLRIIHRDLKASNILLDTNMNPKISDFGMARIFGGNESEANTNRIVGTHGYMSPEYALEGVFSIKSDVFSFGVLLLEILSGQKNTGFYQLDCLHLLGYAWELWSSDKGSALVDPLLHDDMSSMSMVLRYINIALLCVQESAADRPTMSDVVAMLSNDSTVLPYPNQPGFLFVRSKVKANPISGVSDFSYLKNATVSIVEGR